MKAGDLVFVHGTSIISKIIQWWTNSYWSHVAVAVSSSEFVEAVKQIKGVCRDPEDDKFISCAVSGSAGYLVSGDQDLPGLKQYQSVKIIRASEFLKMFKDA